MTTTRPTFQEWLAAAQDAAIVTPAGVILNNAYFHITTTGGNCLAWERLDSTEQFQVLITVDEEETQPSDEIGSELTDVETARWIVGIYKMTDGAFYNVDALGLTDAIAKAEQFLATPADIIAKHGEAI